MLSHLPSVRSMLKNAALLLACTALAACGGGGGGGGGGISPTPKQLAATETIYSAQATAILKS